ncbi:MAG: hypothetical protein AUH89_04155 [Ktedonobacter sp. 13_1_40CM_4_52_4]|nr:MAG: hypothetical protein AUH89_04155 [Ktedonobacter sp. 13_1_40CM_4_52_4]
MIEVELKCDLSSESLLILQEKLRTTKFHKRVMNSDVYYDTSTLDLLRQAVFVRVRNNYQLQFKFNERQDIAHVQCIERIFSLPLDQVSAEEANSLFARFLPIWSNAFRLETVIDKNGLIELAHIENTREVYSSDNMYLCIDHVKGLGDFLEIEMQSEEDANTSEALSKLQTFASDINLKPINIGYVEMWLRGHNSQAYQLSKYRL